MGLWEAPGTTPFLQFRHLNSTTVAKKVQHTDSATIILYMCMLCVSVFVCLYLEAAGP